MAQFYPIYDTDNNIKNTPKSTGTFYVATDTNIIYYDESDDVRVVVINAIHLLTDSQRLALSAPLSTIYEVQETHSIWMYENAWICIVGPERDNTVWSKVFEKPFISIDTNDFSVTSEGMLQSNITLFTDAEATQGTVPSPVLVDEDLFLTATGEWVDPVDRLSSLLPIASTSTLGVIKSGGNIQVDELSGVVSVIGGDVTTAERLKTVRKINGVDFDGTTDITIVDSSKVSTYGSVVAGNVPIYTGTTGKLISDSGFTIASSVPENAVFTDTTYDVFTTAANGLVPSPEVVSSSQYLRADGVWSVPEGSGSVSYTDVFNKPSINNVELVGNKTTSDLNISYTDLTDKPTSLPANGGNADTLNNLSSSDFVLANNYVGKNILDNPDFKINQLGLTAYTDTSQTVDRWHMGQSSGVLNVFDDYITWTSADTSYCNLIQRLSTNVPIGETITLSATVEDFSGASLILGVNGVYYTTTADSNTKQRISVTASITTQDYQTVCIQTNNASTRKIYNVKLEYGEVATLFVPPNYADELLRIQSINDNDGTTKLLSTPIMLSNMVSNPNLIDNPDFKINQRRLLQYTTAGYTVDRWKITAGDTLTVTNKGIKYEPALIDGYRASQKIRDVGIGSFTLSANVVSFTNAIFEIGIRLVNRNDSSYYTDIIATITQTGVCSASGVVPENCRIDEVSIAAYGAVSGDYVEIAWAKLEQGTVPTAFVSPNPSEELLKIQSMNDEGSTTLLSNYVMLSGMVSNPNILDNPDFKINQRGETVYTASGMSYCVDRWRTYKTASLVGNFTATPTATGLTLDNQSNGACAISQIIEQFADLFGKTVTLSVCVDDVVYHTTATPANITGAYGLLTTSFGRMQIYVTADTRVSIDVYVNAGVQCVVNWAKLEYGSVATLFTIPNPATELARCQRYYYKWSVFTRYPFSYHVANTYSFVISTPVPMRVLPTITNLQFATSFSQSSVISEQTYRIVGDPRSSTFCVRTTTSELYDYLLVGTFSDVAVEVSADL